MKRKFLSIFLTLAMALTLLPTAAMAEGADPVAQIGEKTYATLKAAFEEAKNGDTVTLLKDVETNNIEDTEAARIIINKEITLNLNDKTIRTPNDMGNNINNFCALIIDADVTINATAEGGINTGTNGGYAINVRNGAKLTINGGTYYGGGTAVQVQKGTLIINDGTFACEPYSNPTYGYKFLINCIDAAWKDGTAKISIKGGTFVKFDPSDSASENPHGKFLAEGYGVKQDGDNYIVTEPVAAIGDTKYPTLADAITAAEAGGTVTLLKDVTGMAVIPSGKTVTIDLSGHTITRTVTSGENSEIYPALYVNGGTLTLDDTSEGKTGRVLSEITDTTVSGAMSNAVYVNGGAFTLKNGALAATAAAAPAPANNTWDTAYGVYVNKSTFTMENGSVTVTAPDGGAYGIAILGPNGVFTMNDGAVTADGFAISGNGSSGVGDTKITINKGTVTGGTLAIYHPQSGELKINGGTLTGKGGIETKAGNTTVSIDGNPTIVATGTPSHSINNNGNSSEGYAISVVENKNYAGGANVSIASGYYKGEVRILVDNEVADDKKGSIIITGGLFSSEPAEKYIAEKHYVDASNNGDYPYTVKEGTKPAGALIVVKDKTDTAVNGDITVDDKTAINNVISKANVDGVAEAVAPAKKADIVAKSSATVAENDKVEIEVAVKVEAKDADLANGKLTFEASPVATVKVNGATKGTTVPVTNDMLNGQPITVKLPLPAGFTPKQIKHISSDGSVEYFLKTAKRGANTFEIKDGCAVFTITKFSTFELSGTITYVEPSSGSGSSSSSRRYDVSAPSVKHGDVTVSPKSASKGDTVTITVKPDSGYVLETLTVTDKNGNELTLKDKGNGKYTFTMPAGKVEVKATFMEDNSVLNFFYDVPNDAYFYEAVKWAVKNGITNGVGDNLFAPGQPCTRAQIVTFLWRAAGSPEPKGTAAGMTDVVPGSYYAKAVAWAVENGITTGTAEGTFSPDATCTRAQAVTFLARAQNATATGKTAFSDVPADSYFADAVAWAQANGVTTGTSETTFSPDNDCTRAQIVTFLYRANQGT